MPDQMEAILEIRAEGEDRAYKKESKFDKKSEKLATGQITKERINVKGGKR